MPRVPYRNPEDVRDDVRELMQRQLAQRGYVLNLYRALANSPRMLQRFTGLGAYLRNDSLLDPALRELAILTVGRLTQARYAYEHHVEHGRSAGLTAEQIGALPNWGSSPLFDERQRAVIRYAWQATERVRVADAVAEAVQQFLGPEQFTDLVVTVAFYNMIVRILEPLQIDLEEGFEAPHD